MAELKTKVTKASVKDFINGIADEQRRKDCHAVAAMMEKATGAKPKMWGPSIVGFGDFEYVNSTRKPQAWFRCGFSPRKNALTLYLMGGYPKDAATVKKLGKFSTGASCLYLKRLDDVHLPTLKTLIAQSLRRIKSGRVEYSK
jgi:hypothetical protein